MVFRLLMVALVVLSGAEPAEAPPESANSEELGHSGELGHSAAPADVTEPLEAEGLVRAPVSPQAQAPSDPAGAFRQALLGALTPDERVAALEQIVKDHPKSPWADDALWVLGETARKLKPERHDKVIYYWQFLMAQHPHVELEGFTRTLGVYKTSGLPQAQFYLTRTGRSYVLQAGVTSRLRGTRRVLINARAFNTVPMSVWAGLGHAYRALGKHKPALAAYRNAQRAAPIGGLWRKQYDARIRALERLVPVEEPEAAEPAGGDGKGEPVEAAPASDDPGGEDKDNGAGSSD